MSLSVIINPKNMLQHHRGSNAIARPEHIPVFSAQISSKLTDITTAPTHVIHNRMS
jgi:hypothetical protein